MKYVAYFAANLIYFNNKTDINLMNITEQVKELIADGKTQEALDWLQQILKDKDTNLLNQTYLLEGQYKDFLQKMRLGMEDASTDLNRINFTLLSICDDVEKAGITGSKLKTPQQDETKSTSNIALIAFGIITLLAILIVIGIIYFGNKNNAGGAKIVQLEKKARIKTDNWTAIPTTAIIRYFSYGNFKIDIKSITTERKDANTKTLIISLKLTCLESGSGSCINSYLQYRLIKPNNEIDTPIANPQYTLNSPKNGAITEGAVSFDVPIALQKSDLKIFYTEQEKATAIILNLAQN